LNYGNSDNCDFRFSTADCKSRMVGMGWRRPARLSKRPGAI